MKRPKEAFIIGSIILLSLVLNAFGIYYALPHVINHDEARVVYSTMNIMKTGDVFLNNFIYPGGVFYLMLLVFLLTYLVSRLSGGLFTRMPDISAISRRDWSPFIKTGRIFTACTGALTVFMTYLIGKRYFNERTALFGAFTLAVSPLFVSQSHTILPNIPTLFMIVCALYYISDMKDDSAGTLLSAGLLAGLTIGIKYNAVVVLLSALFSACLSFRPRQWPRSWGIIIVGSLAGFFALNFSLLKNFPTFLGNISYLYQAYQVNLGSVSTFPRSNGVFYTKFLVFEDLGAGIFVLFLFGLVKSLFKSTRPQKVIAFFTVTYLVAIGVSRAKLSRHALFLYPFIAIYCGSGCDWVIGWLSRTGKRSVYVLGTVVVCAVVFFHPVKKALTADLNLLRPDTRNIANEWMIKNIPEGASMLIEDWYLRPYEEGGCADTVPVDPARYDVDYFRGHMIMPWDLYQREYLVVWSFNSSEDEISEIKKYINPRKRFPRFKLKASGPNITIYNVTPPNMSFYKWVYSKDIAFIKDNGCTFHCLKKKFDGVRLDRDEASFEIKADLPSGEYLLVFLAQDASVDKLTNKMIEMRTGTQEIGRASCRERV